MKNIFLLLVFLPAACLLAQTVTVSESVVLRDDASYDIIGDDRGNVLLFRDKGTSFEVQGFDSKMRLSWEKAIELDKKSPEVEKVVPTAGGGFSVIYQFRQKSQPVLKIHRYSAAANLIDSVTIKLFDSAFFTPNYEVVLSEDKNIALIWFMHEQTEINALAFDIRQMKPLWEKTFALEDMLLHRDFQQVVADNAGNMYFILKKDNFNSRRNEHFFEIIDYGPGTAESLRRYLVPMQGNLTFDAFFAYDNLNQALKAGGLYSTDNLSRAEGYFFLSISQANTSDQLLRFYPFEAEFVAVLLEKEKVKNRGIPEASVQDIVMRTDGGIILVGELNKEFQRGTTSTGYYSRSGFRPIIDYYYDDVFLISIHPDGEVHWKKILHKKQYSQDDEAMYSSFFLAKTPAALRLIFNDEIKNENTVSEYIVKGNGDYDHNSVMSTQRQELQLRFRDAVQVAANEFVVPSERRSRLKLVRVAY